MKKVLALLAVLSTLVYVDVAWAAPALQQPAKISDTQMAIAIVGFLLITAGSFYFVWRFYPRGDKKEDKKDDKK